MRLCLRLRLRLHLQHQLCLSSSGEVRGHGGHHTAPVRPRGLLLLLLHHPRKSSSILPCCSGCSLLLC